MSTVQLGLRYSAEHEWVNDETPTVVGITQVAADALGEIVYVELPEVGDTVTSGEVMGEVESTKSVSDLFSPVTGEVVAVNETVTDDPTLVNSAPYGEGWLVKVAVTQEGPLLTAEQYAQENGVQL
ncbi:glycine cleavage system protein GcvH [Leucobacter sp. UCMA 4100]|uniref:glycine cleavage system protein GcvH n=1 Tax=Leucobacter sp. UCMA 4100 TaxID=2810534 RepID=UPI0022EAB418|nr:glycine cleavage system protein GcvH [Leucobacter sp. UCMA 4100]MDA3146980.1 glycine cleavage system protein GcvH [Leucobacter sp. UCMA 4100]